MIATGVSSITLGFTSTPGAAFVGLGFSASTLLAFSTFAANLAPKIFPNDIQHEPNPPLASPIPSNGVITMRFAAGIACL